MKTGQVAIVSLAAAVALGAGAAMLLDDPSTSSTRAIELEERDEAAFRRDDAADEIATIDDEPDGDGDRTHGNDGTGGGNNTGDGDATGGNDGTGGGDNTGDGDRTNGNDGTGGGDNTYSAPSGAATDDGGSGGTTG